MIKFVTANQISKNMVIIEEENNQSFLLKVLDYAHSKTGKHGAGKIVFDCCDYITESKKYFKKCISTDSVKVPDLSEYSVQGIITNFYYENIALVWPKYKLQEKDTRYIDLNLDSARLNKPIMLEVSYIKDGDYKNAYFIIYKSQLGSKYPDVPMNLDAWSSYTLNIIDSPFGRKIVSIQ